MTRWLGLLMISGCVGGLDAELRLPRPDASADEVPSAQVALDASSESLDAAKLGAAELDAAPDASDAADARE
ncbi:MAG: hypothetical protein ABW352_14850 [Polyangiales bacterium]